MFDSLSQLWGVTPPLLHRVVVIVERSPSCDGSFLLQHFLSASLQSAEGRGSRGASDRDGAEARPVAAEAVQTSVCDRQIPSVVVVGYGMTYLHYATVQRKMSTPLEAAPHFAFVDGLSRRATATSAAPQPSPLVFAGPASALATTDSTSAARPAHYHILPCDYSAAPAGRGGDTVDVDQALLLVDDLFEAVDFNLTRLHSFLRKRQSTGLGLCALWRPHAAASDAEERHATAVVYSMADVILEVQPLENGYSRDVHGTVTIRERDSSGMVERRHGPWLFKRTEFTVKFYSPGAQTI